MNGWGTRCWADLGLCGSDGLPLAPVTSFGSGAAHPALGLTGVERARWRPLEAPAGLAGGDAVSSSASQCLHWTSSAARARFSAAVSWLLFWKIFATCLKSARANSDQPAWASCSLAGYLGAVEFLEHQVERVFGLRVPFRLVAAFRGRIAELPDEVGKHALHLPCHGVPDERELALSLPFSQPVLRFRQPGVCIGRSAKCRSRLEQGKQGGIGNVVEYERWRGTLQPQVPPAAWFGVGFRRAAFNLQFDMQGGGMGRGRRPEICRKSGSGVIVPQRRCLLRAGRAPRLRPGAAYGGLA
jgi:hypothetical protein